MKPAKPDHDKIRALSARATSGTWRIYHSEGDWPFEVHVAGVPVAWVANKDDALLVCGAPEAIRLLLAEVDRLGAMLDRVDRYFEGDRTALHPDCDIAVFVSRIEARRDHFRAEVERLSTCDVWVRCHPPLEGGSTEVLIPAGAIVRRGP